MPCVLGRSRLRLNTLILFDEEPSNTWAGLRLAILRQQAIVPSLPIALQSQASLLSSHSSKMERETKLTRTTGTVPCCSRVRTSSAKCFDIYLQPRALRPVFCFTNPSHGCVLGSPHGFRGCCILAASDQSATAIRRSVSGNTSD